MFFFQSLSENKIPKRRLKSQSFVLLFGRPLGFPVYGLFFLLTEPFGLPRGFPVGTYVDFFTFFSFPSESFFSTGAMSLLCRLKCRRPCDYVGAS